MSKKFYFLLSLIGTSCLSSCQHSGSTLVTIRAVDAHSRLPLTHTPVRATFQTVVFGSIARPNRFKVQTDDSGIAYLRDVADGHWTIVVSPEDREAQMVYFSLDESGLRTSAPKITADGAAVALVASDIYSPPTRKTLIYAKIVPPIQRTRP